jgi:hypothetical protein
MITALFLKQIPKIKITCSRFAGVFTVLCPTIKNIVFGPWANNNRGPNSAFQLGNPDHGQTNYYTQIVDAKIYILIIKTFHILNIIRPYPSVVGNVG